MVHLCMCCLPEIKLNVVKSFHEGKHADARVGSNCN